MAVNTYELNPENHPDKTYGWWLARVEAVIKVQEQRRNKCYAVVTCSKEQETQRLQLKETKAEKAMIRLIKDARMASEINRKNRHHPRR